MRIVVAILASCTILLLAVALTGTDARAQSMSDFPIWCHQNGIYYKANLATDSNNCGGCGLVCPGEGVPCKTGKCVDSVCSAAKRKLINVNQNLSDKTAFHTIQAAVDAANPCDTIHVAPGNYKENIKIDKSLSIDGSGESWTTVDGSQAGCVFEIGSTNHGIKVTLADVKIQNGLTANNGGGILNSGILMLWRCNVTRNKAREGGGVYNNGPSGNLKVSDSTISGNAATDCGGGIFNWANVTISGAASKIIGNKASNSGGGVYSWGNVIVSGSSISRNVASSGSGGGLFNWGNLTVTSKSIISWNMARNGGGIFSARSGNSLGTLTLKNCTFIGNAATGAATSSGGGINNQANATIDRCTIGTTHITRGYGNIAAFGGGIYSFGSAAKLTVTHSTISWNGATVRGGGIYSQAADLTCDPKQVYGNSPDNIFKV